MTGRNPQILGQAEWALPLAGCVGWEADIYLPLRFVVQIKWDSMWTGSGRGALP